MSGIIKYISGSFILLILLTGVFLLLVNWNYNHLQRKFSATIQDSIQHAISMNETQVKVNMDPSKLHLLPLPKQVVLRNGIFRFPGGISFNVVDSLIREVGADISRQLKRKAEPAGGGSIIQLIEDKDLTDQAYRLSIAPDFITIRYKSLTGIHYALVSLKILEKNYPQGIPCAEISDWPDLGIRGALIDISRNKIPTMETLYHLVDLLADLKYNHLELYMEGFSYEYPSFSELKNIRQTPITKDEIVALDQYCQERFIELVPNQNSLGHMAPWLSLPEFKALAECPDGFQLMGMHREPGTLNPEDPASLELVARMSDDLLPAFHSGLFNVNLDEPFELGLGKNKTLASKEGVGPVYLAYVKKMNRMVKERNKKMLMWGDILLKYPLVINDLPADITILDWGYERGYPFEKNAAFLKAHNRDFFVCPGTSSWLSFTGRTDNMLANIQRAALAGKQFTAKGMLVTDWGDMGHLQYLPASYPGFIAGGAQAWNSEDELTTELPEFLNRYIFADASSRMGAWVLEAGRYSVFEDYQRMNGTASATIFQYGICNSMYLNAAGKKSFEFIENWIDTIDTDWKNELKNQFLQRKNFDFEGLTNWIDRMNMELDAVNLHCSDARLVLDEYTNSLRMIRLGNLLQQYILLKNSRSREESLRLLDDMNLLLKTVESEHERLWKQRNRSGELEQSLKPFMNLETQIGQQVRILNSSGPIGWFNRIVERIKVVFAIRNLG